MRKCTRCFVKMKKQGTMYLSKENPHFVPTPVFVYECPICGKLELVKVET